MPGHETSNMLRDPRRRCGACGGAIRPVDKRARGAERRRDSYHIDRHRYLCTLDAEKRPDLQTSVLDSEHPAVFFDHRGDAPQLIQTAHPAWRDLPHVLRVDPSGSAAVGPAYLDLTRGPTYFGRYLGRAYGVNDYYYYYSFSDKMQSRPENVSRQGKRDSTDGPRHRQRLGGSRASYHDGSFRLHSTFFGESRDTGACPNRSAIASRVYISTYERPPQTL